FEITRGARSSARWRVTARFHASRFGKPSRGHGAVSAVCRGWHACRRSHAAERPRLRRKRSPRLPIGSSARPESSPPESHPVAQVTYSDLALQDLDRIADFLLDAAPASAETNLLQIQSAIAILSAHPRIGRRTRGQLRELVISVGASGYLA